MSNKKENRYSSSSYSGADIRVIATMNSKSLEKVKENVLKAKADEAKLIKAIQKERSSIELVIAKLVADGETETEALRKKVESQFKIEDFSKKLQDLQGKLREKNKILSESQVELGTVQTVSCQSHRPKAAVRAIGSTYARGYTRGPRTIAGSMIFTVLNKQSLTYLCNLMNSVLGNQVNDSNPGVLLPDQLLPIDLSFIMANEYGSISRMALYGVEFLNSGYTFSIEDLLLEEVVQFVARDMDPMTDIWDSKHRDSRDTTLQNKPLTARETVQDFLRTRKRTLDRRRL